MTYHQEHLITLWSLCGPKSASILFDIICDKEEEDGAYNTIDLYDLYNDHYNMVMEAMDCFGKSYLCEVLQEAQLKAFLRVSQ